MLLLPGSPARSLSVSVSCSTSTKRWIVSPHIGLGSASPTNDPDFNPYTSDPIYFAADNVEAGGGADDDERDQLELYDQDASVTIHDTMQQGIVAMSIPDIVMTPCLNPAVHKLVNETRVLGHGPLLSAGPEA